MTLATSGGVVCPCSYMSERSDLDDWTRSRTEDGDSSVAPWISQAPQMACKAAVVASRIREPRFETLPSRLTLIERSLMFARVQTVRQPAEKLDEMTKVARKQLPAAQEL